MPGGPTKLEEAYGDLALFGTTQRERWIGVTLLDPKTRIGNTLLETVARKGTETTEIRKTAISRVNAAQSIALLRRLVALDKSPEIRQAANRKLRSF